MLPQEVCWATVLYSDESKNRYTTTKMVHDLEILNTVQRAHHKVVIVVRHGEAIRGWLHHRNGFQTTNSAVNFAGLAFRLLKLFTSVCVFTFGTEEDSCSGRDFLASLHFIPRCPRKTTSVSS